MWPHQWIKERSQLKREYDDELERIDQNHRREIYDIQNVHKAALQSLDQKHFRAAAFEKDKHQQETEKFQASLQSLEEKLEWERDQAKYSINQMTTTFRRDMENRARAFQDEKVKLVQAHEHQTENLVASHSQSVQRLQREIEHINGALFAKDDEAYKGKVFTASGIPSNTDDKIKNQFREIQQMVEELGRLTWKSEQNLWTDQVFEQIPGHASHRALKKNILVDLIWTLLFQYIFYSPFRIFGEEGKKLEKEWSVSCGEEPNAESIAWPEPSVAAERWRYMTIKECKEALTVRLSEIDPRAQAKKGFISSQKNLVTAMKTELGDIADLDSGSLQLIQQLSRKAATTWLDFSMHRCRIVVQLTGSGVETTQEKIELLQNGSLVLTILPQVGRHGNVYGVELERWTVIAGCSGDTFAIP